MNKENEITPPLNFNVGETVPALQAIVVIPVYNHVGTLRGVVEKALAQGYPVMVLDDGSTDGSLESVIDLPIEHHRVSVNSGKGCAILAAAQHIQDHRYNAILTIDADGQHDPADAGLLLEKANSSWPCIVIGARNMDAPNVPKSSIFGRDFSNFWVRLECGQALPDTQSGYRLYPLEFLRNSQFITRRYTFEIEVLVRGRWAGLPILSVPVSVFYAPGDERVSHFHKFKDNFRLSCLHTFLVTRSLIPWPHKLLYKVHTDKKAYPSIFKPKLFLKALCQEHSSPKDLAASVWVGIFIGALPIIPFGIATIVYVCHKLHLNKLAAVGASNLCVAPFVPFMCVEIGYYLIHGQFWLHFTQETLLNEIHLRLMEWLLGSLIVGPVLGLIAALITFQMVRSYQQYGNRPLFFL